MNTKYYVTMTDKFMSGWGEAKGLINKLIFTCSSYEEAQVIEENAHNRTDQIYINITTRKPYYSPSKYYAQWIDDNEYQTWREKGAFSK